MSKLTALKKQIAALEAQAARVAKAEMSSAIANVKDIMSEFDLTIEHLTQTVVGKRAAKKMKAKKASVAKYVDPKSGKTWSGFGRAPGWIAGAKNRDAFLAGKSAAADAPAVPTKVAARAAKAVKVAKKAVAKKGVSTAKKAPVVDAAPVAATKNPAAKKAVPAAKNVAAKAAKVVKVAKKAVKPAANGVSATKKASVVDTAPVAAKNKGAAKKAAIKKSAPKKVAPTTAMPVEPTAAPAA